MSEVVVSIRLEVKSWVPDAPTGAASLAAIDREGPDVVLPDIDLPDLDGVSVLGCIAARDCAASLRSNRARLSPARSVG